MSARSSKGKKSAPAEPLRLTRFAAFQPDAVPRDQIKNAPYNPRKIAESARKRLRANIEKVGLIEPIIWNKRTGFVVGGHQRLKALDALEVTPNYLVPVAVVDLDERTEKAQNVFLNNGEAQGEWDLGVLGDLLKDIREPEDAGFDAGDLYQLFGTNPVTRTAEAEEVARQVAAEATEQVERVKADRPPQNFKAREAKQSDREAADFYLVVVFPNDPARLAFTTALGLPDNRYVDSGVLLERIAGGQLRPDGGGEVRAGRPEPEGTAGGDRP